MNTKIKDGGPAFPWNHNSISSEDERGMTLRDYFAARATEDDIDLHRSVTPTEENNWQTERSREAAKYHYADAMIAERDKN